MDFLGLQMPDLDLPYDSFAADALRMRSAKLRGALLTDPKKAGTAPGVEKKRIGASKNDDRRDYINTFSPEEKAQIKRAANDAQNPDLAKQQTEMDTKHTAKTDAEVKTQTDEAENAGAKLSSKQKKAMAEKEEEIREKHRKDFDNDVTHEDDVLQKERNAVFLNTLSGWRNELKIIEKSKLGAKSGSIDKAVEALNSIIEVSKESFSLKLVGHREKSKKPAYLAKMAVINKTLASLDEALNDIVTSLKDETAKENVAGMKAALLVIPDRIPIEAKHSFGGGEYTSWGSVLEKSMGGYAFTYDVIRHNTVNTGINCDWNLLRTTAKEWNEIGDFTITFSSHFFKQLDNIRMLHNLDLTQEAAYKDMAFFLIETKDASGTGKFVNKLAFKGVSYSPLEGSKEKKKEPKVYRGMDVSKIDTINEISKKMGFHQFKLGTESLDITRFVPVAVFRDYIKSTVPKETEEELVTRFVLSKIRVMGLEWFMGNEGIDQKKMNEYYEDIIKLDPSAVKKKGDSEYELNEWKESTQSISAEKAFLPLIEKILNRSESTLSAKTESGELIIERKRKKSRTKGKKL